jgi:hypothetical protein
MANEEHEFIEVERFPDGGRRMRDSGNGIVFDVCPFSGKGSVCDSPADPLWAMSCPDNYHICETYKTLIRRGK